MALSFRILGSGEGDRALFVQADSGKEVTRLLFDAGEGCPGQLQEFEVLSLDHLFFSTLHMEQLCGFPYILRRRTERGSTPNVLWVPPGGAAIMANHFGGYFWSHRSKTRRDWEIRQINEDWVDHSRLSPTDRFSAYHDLSTEPAGEALVTMPHCTVRAILLTHLGPCVAYRVDEASRQVIDSSLLKEHGLTGGPWLQQVKDLSVESGAVTLGEQDRDIGELRALLMREVPGKSVAWLSGAVLDKPSYKGLSTFLHGCDTVIAMAPYVNADLEEARKNGHCTARQMARLAHMAQAGELILMPPNHSTEAMRQPLLEEATAVFEATRFPDITPLA
ncbi:hypothetical protein KKF84_04610 [Myxococcota bacterium]|nr:hypothetical protein [Myxococcota bacterium]MBU1534578.1 hypothetical protein [Myxococcota bacterium]